MIVGHSTIIKLSIRHIHIKYSYYIYVVLKVWPSLIVRQSLLKVCKWIMVSLETIMRFEGYEGLRVFHVLIIIMVLRVMRVYEGLEGKYFISSCIYYWFRTLNDWRTLNMTYTYFWKSNVHRIFNRDVPDTPSDPAFGWIKVLYWYLAPAG